MSERETILRDEFNLRVFEAIEDDNIPALSRMMESRDMTEFLLAPSSERPGSLMSGNPSSLCVAAFYGSVNAFRYLMGNGADHRRPDDHGVCGFLFENALILLQLVVQWKF
jgi:hypothetical protein